MWIDVRNEKQFSFFKLFPFPVSCICSMWNKMLKISYANFPGDEEEEEEEERKSF